MRYRIKVIWKNGEEEFVQEGLRPGRYAIFTSRASAQQQADFLKMGIGCDAQSINVVRGPMQNDRGGQE